MITHLQAQHEAAHVVAYALFSDVSTVTLSNDQLQCNPSQVNAKPTKLECAEILYAGYAYTLAVGASLVHAANLAKFDFAAIDALGLATSDVLIMIDNVAYLCKEHAREIQTVASLIEKGLTEFSLCYIRRTME